MRLRLPLLLTLAVACLLAACAKTPERDAFSSHWKTQSESRHGYSPSETDRHPQPRVVMEMSDYRDTGTNRPLPSMPVTLKLHNVDVAVALRSLAAAASINVMISPGVSGNASLNVHKTPWKDVFMSLLRANGLEYRWQGNILQVLTDVEKQKEIQMLSLNNQLSQQQTQSRQAGPLSVAVVSIRYADAAALQQTLSKFIANSQDAVIEVDQHSNALVVQAAANVQKRLMALIQHLDRPRPQVHLKAYIVEATKESARELGVQWGGIMRTQANGRGQRFYMGSGGEGTFATDPVTGGYSSSSGNGIGGQPMGLNYSGVVNSTGAGSLAFMFGTIGGNLLETQLNLMEKEGQINILSSPSITTLDNKMAYTENGEKVPYVSKDNEGDNDVKFEEAVLRLEMTPNVIDPNNLKLKILVKKDEVDTSRSVEGNPYIIKKQTETSLILRSGETIVISGLTKEKGVTADAGVPGMRDLPAGKYLFGSTNRMQSMEEVLIFITPVILPVRSSVDDTTKVLPPSPPVLEQENKKNQTPKASIKE